MRLEPGPPPNDLFLWRASPNVSQLPRAGDPPGVLEEKNGLFQASMADRAERATEIRVGDAALAKQLDCLLDQVARRR